MPRWRPMSSASARFELPEKSMSRFIGPISIVFSGLGSAPVVGASRPGSCVSSVVVLSIGISLFRDLPASGDGERAGRDVLRDDRARSDPSIVANRDRSNEHIVAARMDVAADLRAELPRAELGPVVGRDRARADVRPLAHVGIADVGQVRDFRAAAYARVLDLHECARLRSGFEVGSWAKVTEWADGRIGADLRVDDDRVRADDGARGDLRFALYDGEGADLRVGLDLDVGLDPGRLRVDDR